MVARARQMAVPVVTEELQTEAQPTVVMLAQELLDQEEMHLAAMPVLVDPVVLALEATQANGGNSDGGAGGNGASACEGPDSRNQAQPSTL